MITDVLDLGAALAQVEGDRELLHKLFDLFAGQSDQLLAAIEAAITRGDSKALERTAHKLKGSLGSFGADHAVEIAALLERMAHEGNVADALSVYRELESEVASVHQAVKELAACTCAS